MKKASVFNWDKTFAKLGFRRADTGRKAGRKGKRSFSVLSRKNQRPTSFAGGCQYEVLAPRQMLAFNITSFGLVNDTGSSNTDLVTSDPTVSGVLTAGGPVMETGSIEFDHYGDGGVDATIIPQVDIAFEYDPRDSDVSISNHVGPFDLNYRIIETDMFGFTSFTGNWQTLTLDLQADTASDVRVTDELLTDIVDGVSIYDFGLTGVGETVDKTFTIKNLGNEDLLLDQNSLTLPSGFSLVSGFFGDRYA